MSEEKKDAVGGLGKRNTPEKSAIKGCGHKL